MHARMVRGAQNNSEHTCMYACANGSKSEQNMIRTSKSIPHPQSMLHFYKKLIFFSPHGPVGQSISVLMHARMGRGAQNNSEHTCKYARANGSKSEQKHDTYIRKHSTPPKHAAFFFFYLFLPARPRRAEHKCTYARADGSGSSE
jgi:hypothetical protein